MRVYTCVQTFYLCINISIYVSVCMLHIDTHTYTFIDSVLQMASALLLSLSQFVAVSGFKSEVSHFDEGRLTTLSPFILVSCPAPGPPCSHFKVANRFSHSSS